MTAQYKDLEAYGIIGNLETCALVGNDGAIDWLCFPYLESPSVFGAILDADHGGSFQIRPAGTYSSSQAYAGETNVLQTTFNAATGAAVLTDFMPVADRAEGLSVRSVLRKLECVRGEIEIDVTFVPRPDYARAHVALQGDQRRMSIAWGQEQITLDSPVPLTHGQKQATGKAHLAQGESLWFVLQYGHAAPVAEADCEALLHEVQTYWTGWTERCTLCQKVDNPRWVELLHRSALVLKLLVVPENGAVAAAPTTSLPESVGGTRNWDYRFTWVRDTAFTSQALFHLGHAHEAANFRDRMTDAVVRAGGAEHIKVLYPLRGTGEVTERVLEHLAGYRNSAPVRIGNGAADQRQLDIYGEALQASYDTTRYGEDFQPKHWPEMSGVVDYVCQVWDTKDSGIWEVRGGPQHFVYSKLMCWVAVDRGIRIAQLHKLDAPLERWQTVRETIRQAILERGFSTKLNSFVQSFDSEVLDAANLLIPQMEFLPADDPRVQGTIDATLARLTTADGLVHRYLGEDGLPGGEGAFVLCSFWLVTTLALAGRVQEAVQVFERVCRYLSPLGLLAEEVDPVTGKQLGNFPQAFSHLGLVNSVIYLVMAQGVQHTGPKPIGA